MAITVAPMVAVAPKSELTTSSSSEHDDDEASFGSSSSSCSSSSSSSSCSSSLAPAMAMPPIVLGPVKSKQTRRFHRLSSLLSKRKKRKQQRGSLTEKGTHIKKVADPITDDATSKTSALPRECAKSTQPLFDDRLFQFLLERTLDDDERLTEIMLDHWSIGDDHLKLLSAALANNTHVSTLSLRHNNLTARGCEYLALCLEQNMSVSRLYLDDNPLGDEGVQHIIMALTHAENGNASLLELGLCRVDLSSGGAKRLAESLKNHRDKIHIHSVYLDAGKDCDEDDSGLREIEEELSVSLSSSRVSAVFVVEPGSFDNSVDEAEKLRQSSLHGCEGSQQRLSDVGIAPSTDCDDNDGASTTNTTESKTEKEVKRLGVVYSPPTFLVEYEEVASAHSPHFQEQQQQDENASNNVYHKKIFLKSLKPTSKPHKVTKALIRAHPDCLSEGQVPYEQIYRLVAALIEHYDATMWNSTAEDSSIDGMLTASILEDVQLHPQDGQEGYEYQFLGLQQAMHLACVSSESNEEDHYKHHQLVYGAVDGIGNDHDLANDHFHDKNEEEEKDHELVYGAVDGIGNEVDDWANNHFQNKNGYDDKEEGIAHDEKDSNDADGSSCDSENSDDEEDSVLLHEEEKMNYNVAQQKMKKKSGLFRSMRRRVTGRR